MRWAAHGSAICLALATGLAALAAAPANAAPVGGSTKTEIVTHALRYAPRSATPSLYTAGVITSIAGATATMTSHSGTASLTTSDPADSIVQAEPGGVRELTVLNHGNTARFVLSVPTGANLHRTSTGGFLVLNRAAKAVGLIAAPWAVDARGKLLPTHYTADGNVIVQTVDTRGAAYPIVADPNFHWYWNGVVITLTWADQMAVAEWGLTALVPILLASGVGWSVVGAVGWVAGWAGVYASRHQCFWFWVPYISPLGTKWGTYRC